MAEPLLLAGCLPSGGSLQEGEGAAMARSRSFMAALERAGVRYELLDISGLPSKRRLSLRSLRRGGGFSAVAAISPYPAEAVLRSGCELPVWVDMNGMHPAESQLTGGCKPCARDMMARMLALESLLISKGDRFSTPSRRQKLALTGELLLIGRLDATVTGLDPVHVIPHRATPVPTKPGGGQAGEPGLLKVISTGSFNRWFDHLTLFQALETAMDKAPGLTFTATGGRIPHSPDSWDEFQRLVAGSPHRDRYEMRGWIPGEELEEVYASAGAAVYADIPCSETLLGARTRVLDWIARGIPVVCTRGAEIAEEIRTAGIGIVVPQRDPAAMAGAFLRLCGDPSAGMGIRAGQEAWMSTRGSAPDAFKPFVEWVSHPSRLPVRPIGRMPVPAWGTSRYNIFMIARVLRERGLSSLARKFMGMAFRKT